MFKKAIAGAVAAATLALGAAFVPQAAEAGHDRERFVAFCEYMGPSGTLVSGPVQFDVVPGRADMVWADGFRRTLYWEHGYAIDDVGDTWISYEAGRDLFLINDRTGARLFCTR